MQAVPLSANNAGMMHCGVFLHSGRWEFHHIPENALTASCICHELMHICLYLEGWPIFYRKINIVEGSYEHIILSLLLNTVQHVELWDRVRILGYDNDVQNEIHDVQFVLLPRLRDGSLYSQAPSMPRSSLIAACLTQALLSPLPRQVKREIRRVAQQKFPRPMELCLALSDLLDKARPLSGQSSVEVLRKSCEVVSLPKESLRHEFPPNSSPDMFARIQRLLGV